MIVIAVTVFFAIKLYEPNDTNIVDFVLYGLVCFNIFVFGMVIVGLIGDTAILPTTFKVDASYQIACNMDKQNIEIETIEEHNHIYYLVNINDNGTEQTVKLKDDRVRFEQRNDTEVPYIEVGRRQLKNVWLYAPPLPIEQSFVIQYPSWYEIED